MSAKSNKGQIHGECCSICKYLHLGPVTTDHRYLMLSDSGNELIEKVEEEKDLGIIIDSV